MATGGLSREHFICSVCLDVFSNPVTIPCGHNFCQGCVQAYWNKGECSCPLCMRQFVQRPELAMNHVLDTLSNTLRLEEPHPEPAKISIPPMNMAGKFTAIAEDLAQPRDVNILCDKHGQPLSLFCLDDKALVCAQCVSLGHKTHKTTPAEEQISQIKQRLLKELLARKNNVCAVKTEILKAKNTMESFKISASLQKQEQQTNFTMLISAITEGQKQLMASIEEKEKEMLLKAESEVQKMEKRFMSLEDEVTGMELTLQGEEPGRLLQDYNALQKGSVDASPYCVSLDPEERLVQAGELREMLHMEVERIWKDQGSAARTRLCVDPTASRSSLSTLKQYEKTITLDPNSVGRHTWLSPDMTSAKNTAPHIQPHTPHPERLKQSNMVRGTQGLSSGCHFWKVNFRNLPSGSQEDSYYEVGVMYKENAGKMKESWRIRFSTSQSMPYVEAYSGETVHTITTGNKFLSSIHMYLDYDSGILAVYSNVSNIVVNTRKSNLDNAVNRVYSFNTKFSEPLYPMFVIPKGADIRLN
ncbi:E3 ubiquitin-protein ligase TRIM11 [Salmo salar]|uniref:E3 ubiquitin-protein ligase TRIM11 n=1 Tax=Salmo salar TaxID=8030 RepID=A0ABM3DXU8_SALSA|nr:E3 ubiquitin-protein ligase TRIM11-like [Salmo salar]|eukprot:XP_014017321.1 PREDICTED: E3 ubiquitin-protein ligase TRIM11-like [Salmo salar]